MTDDELKSEIKLIISDQHDNCIQKINLFGKYCVYVLRLSKYNIFEHYRNRLQQKHEAIR